MLDLKPSSPRPISGLYYGGSNLIGSVKQEEGEVTSPEERNNVCLENTFILQISVHSHFQQPSQIVFLEKQDNRYQWRKLSKFKFHTDEHSKVRILIQNLTKIAKTEPDSVSCWVPSTPIILNHLASHRMKSLGPENYPKLSHSFQYQLNSTNISCTGSPRIQRSLAVLDIFNLVLIRSILSRVM